MEPISFPVSIKNLLFMISVITLPGNLPQKPQNHRKKGRSLRETRERNTEARIEAGGRGCLGLLGNLPPTQGMTSARGQILVSSEECIEAPHELYDLANVPGQVHWVVFLWVWLWQGAQEPWKLLGLWLFEGKMVLGKTSASQMPSRGIIVAGPCLMQYMLAWFLNLTLHLNMF